MNTPPMRNAGTPPLKGVRVVEIASEAGAYAGKLFGDAGADVVLVEPPGGHATRAFAPFVGDQPHPDRSLYFWTNNTSKRSVILDLDQPKGREAFKRLVTNADFLIDQSVSDRCTGMPSTRTSPISRCVTVGHSPQAVVLASWSMR